MRPVVAALILVVSGAVGARAQSVEGDWQGTIKAGGVELRVVVHVSRDDKGALKGTLDSPDQGANGIPVTSISVAESTLKFEVGAVGGAYEGKVDSGATAITGMWSQLGRSIPLDLTRAQAAAAKNRVAKPSDIDGDWNGALAVQNSTLEIVLHITSYEDGMTAKMDVPAQGAMGLPATSISREGATVTFAMKQIGGSFSGTLDKDLTTISGTWGQLGMFQPLVLKRTKR